MAQKDVRTNIKRVLYTGYPGDKSTAFVFHGIEFGPRQVQPVSDELYEAVRHIRGFVTVDQVRTSVLSFENKVISGLDLEDANEKKDSLVF